MTEENNQQKYHERSLGMILHDIRESKSLGLQAVALRLKIDRRQLEALENDDYYVFPAHVYARGTFEKYADFLGLDRDEALHLFEDMWKKERVSDVLSAAPRQRNTLLAPSGDRISKKILAGGIVSIILAVGGIGIWITMMRVPAFTFDEPADRTITHERRIVVEGTADPRIELTFNKQPVYIGENGIFQHAVVLQAGVNELVLEGKTRFGKYSHITKYIVVQ